MKPNKKIHGKGSEPKNKTEMKEMMFPVWLIMKGNPDKSISENMNDYMSYQFKLPDNRIIKPEGRRRTYKHFVNDFKTQTQEQ